MNGVGSTRSATLLPGCSSSGGTSLASAAAAFGLLSICTPSSVRERAQKLWATGRGMARSAPMPIDAAELTSINCVRTDIMVIFLVEPTRKVWCWTGEAAETATRRPDEIATQKKSAISLREINA